MCESPGLFRGTISSFSVVVSYSCTRGLSFCDGSELTDQFQYDCNLDNSFRRAEIPLGSVRTPNPIATLGTPLNAQCAQCVEPNGFLSADQVDHCVGKFQIAEKYGLFYILSFLYLKYVFRIVLKVKGSVSILLDWSIAATGIFVVGVWLLVLGI